MDEKKDIQKEVLLETVLCSSYGWKQHPNYQKDGKCEICLDDSMIGSYVLETRCGHAFHQSCILLTLISKFTKCPSCMKSYEKN